MDYGCVYQLVLLDLSTAFDTIDHKILLNRLGNYFCIHGIVLSWFKSFLSDRHQFVALNEEVYRSQVQYGAPQGSVLGPLLFKLCYLWVISSGNMVLAFTVMLMILSSLFLHTNLQK